MVLVAWAVWVCVPGGKEDIVVTQVNEIATDATGSAHLLKFDSVHGTWAVECGAGKASVKTLTQGGGDAKLFKWAAVLKGAGFFVGAAFLEWVSFRWALAVLAGLLLIVLVLSGWAYQSQELEGCLWWSAGFVLLASVLSFKLPEVSTDQKESGRCLNPLPT